jgi:hypothetical protein
MTLMVSMLSVSPKTRADQVDARATARMHFQNGVEAVSRGDLEVAVDHFDAAYALSPEPVVLYNLGLTHSALGHPVEAVKAFEQYLASRPPPAPGARTEEVLALVRTNRRRIGMLALDVEPPTAAIEVDGVGVELSAGKVRLVAGPHAVVARVPGRAPGVLNVTVAPETETSARIVLPPAAPPPGLSQRAGRDTRPREQLAPRASDPRSDALPMPALLSGGVGIALLGASAALAVTARDLEQTAKAQGHCNDRDCDEIGLPLREAAGKRANVATALFAAGGALVGAGVALYFVLDRGGSSVSGAVRAVATKAADGSVGSTLALRLRL